MDKNSLSVKEKEEIKRALSGSGVIEIDSNCLTSREMEERGYKKIEYPIGFEALFREIPRILSLEKAKYEANQSFNQAIAGSYRCILDPGKHLACIKDNPELFIGAALDDNTNILAGQARFMTNDGTLIFSRQIVPKVFDGLSMITAQYFMEQINDKLEMIEREISGLKEYLNHKQQGELENAFKTIQSIMKHMEYQKTPERINDTMIELKSAEKVAGDSIGLYRREIYSLMKKWYQNDTCDQVQETVQAIRQYLSQYYYAIGTLNVAKMITIALRKINNVDELKLFKAELDSINSAYINLYDEAMEWCENYINKANSLNKVSTGEKFFAGTAQGLTWLLSGALYAALPVAGYALMGTNDTIYKSVNEMYLDQHLRMKDSILSEHRGFSEKVRERELVDNCTDVMDKYIISVKQPVEVVSIGDEYYLKN